MLWANWAEGNSRPLLHRLRDCVRLVRSNGLWLWHETPCESFAWKYNFICQYHSKYRHYYRRSSSLSAFFPPTKEEVDVFARVCLFVCLSVSKITQLRVHAFEWNVACAWTYVGTCTNWLTFETDPDHSPNAGTGLLSPISYRLRNFAALPMLPASCVSTRNFTSGKSHVYVLAERR